MWWSQIDRFPSLYRVKLFSFCIHILHGFLNVRVFMSITLSNIARIVFETSCIWKYLLLKVLNDLFIIILVFYLTVSMSTHAEKQKIITHNMMHKLTLMIYLVTLFFKKHSIKKMMEDLYSPSSFKISQRSFFPMFPNSRAT